MRHTLLLKSGTFQGVLLPRQNQLLAQHCKDVGRYALKIGKAMGLDRTEQKTLHFAGVHHDAGKLRTKESVELFFQFQGRFSAEQRIQAAHHPVDSAELVLEAWEAGRIRENFEIVIPGVVAIRGHHWPNHAAETKYQELLESPSFIPYADLCNSLGYFPLLAAKILKVSDCFVAAKERRHYDKPILDEQEAYTQLASNELEYDPEVVAALWLIISGSKRMLKYHS